MEKKKVRLNNSDREKLAELYNRAQTTPVIAFNLGAARAGENMATLAWNSVWKFMDVLGKKYGFNPTVCAINTVTGEVREVKEIGSKDKKW